MKTPTKTKKLGTSTRLMLKTLKKKTEDFHFTSKVMGKKPCLIEKNSTIHPNPKLDQLYISYPSCMAMVIDLSILQLSKNSSAQEILFLKSQQVSESINKLYTLFHKHNSIKRQVSLKGNNPRKLTQAIQLKSMLRGYSQLADIYDITRGRINVDFESKVEIIIAALINHGNEFGLRLKKRVEPKNPLADLACNKPISTLFVYPRVHLIFEDKEGFVFECQIGTQATTELYETKGIQIPKYLPEGFKNNLHGIVYKYFFNLERPLYEQMIKTTNFKNFIDKLNATAIKSRLLGAGYTNLHKDIHHLHHEAEKILLQIGYLIDDTSSPKEDKQAVALYQKTLV